jgi:hypothetical protein
VSHHLLLKQCVFESNNLYWVSAQGKNSYNTFQTANKKLKHCLNFYPLLVFKLLENINLRLSLVLASKVYIQYAEHMVRSRSNIALTADPASPTLCVSLIPPPRLQFNRLYPCYFERGHWRNSNSACGQEVEVCLRCPKFLEI